jgi:hypothetical protein
VAAIHAAEVDRLRYALKWLESQGHVAAFQVTQALDEANIRSQPHAEDNA